MSCLPMSGESFTRSICGLKWETRRHWKSQRVTPGKSYRILRMGVDGLFTERKDAPAYALVTDVWEEPLGEIDAASAVAEGGFTISEFKDLWRELHGWWDPTEEIYVVQYDTYLTDPKEWNDE